MLFPFANRHSPLTIPAVPVECPRCRTPVPMGRRLFKAWAWARWDCDVCGSTLGFSLVRRFLVATAMMLLLVAGNAASLIFLRGGPRLWMVLVAVVVLPIAATWVAMKMERIVVHISRGTYCEGCGYNLSGASSQNCPECGRTFTIPHAIVMARPMNGDAAAERHDSSNE